MGNLDEIKTDSISPCAETGGNCYWVIDPPNGPVSKGSCKKCGQEKEFKNSFEYNTWHGERPINKDQKDKNKEEKRKG